MKYRVVTTYRYPAAGYLVGATCYKHISVKFDTKEEAETLVNRLRDIGNAKKVEIIEVEDESTRD